MIEIFETCQTKSIAKQTNRDESLIIRSIVEALKTVWMINFVQVVVYSDGFSSVKQPTR